MGFGMKITVTDILFSELVRTLAKWTCVRCGRKHEPKQNTMDTSHYYGRGAKSVKYDFENADALCRYPCHQGKDSSKVHQFGWEYQKQRKGEHGNEIDGAYTAYKKKQLGEKKFNALMIRAHTPTKVDEKTLRMAFREELKRLSGAAGEVFGRRSD